MGGNDGCYISPAGGGEYRISKVILNDDHFIIIDNSIFGYIENSNINYADIESIKKLSNENYEIISTEYSDEDFIKNEYGDVTRYLKDNVVPKKYRFLVKIIDTGSRSVILEREKM